MRKGSGSGKGSALVIQQLSSAAPMWSSFTSLLSTVVLLLNLYLAGLLLRPLGSLRSPLQLLDVPEQQQQQQERQADACTTCVDFAALRKAGLLVDSPLRTAGIFLHTIIVTGAYRTGEAGWAAVGLGPLQVFRHKDECEFECVWVDAGGGSAWDRRALVRSKAVQWDTPGSNYRPGSYITLVLDCAFPKPVGAGGGGGALLLLLTTRPKPWGLNVSSGRPMVGWSGPAHDDAWMAQDLQPLYSELQQQSDASPVQVVAATEQPHRYHPSNYAAPYRYENLYCGSPLHVLHGNLSVSAVVEWLSYHFYLLGTDSHFVIHDAGAVSGDEEMRKALEPWVNLGIVTVENVEKLLHLDTYYFNQNLLLNDCLHKYKYAAQRLWFFDVDEFIVIRPPHTLQSLLTRHSKADVLKFLQLRFSDTLCRPESRDDVANKWNAERLFFRNHPRVPGEQKYALLNPRNILSTGIHTVFRSTAENGKFRSETANRSSEAAYYHYHDTIMRSKSDLCTSLLPANASTAKAGDGLVKDWEYDDAILSEVAAAKSFIRAFFAARKLASPV